MNPKTIKTYLDTIQKRTMEVRQDMSGLKNRLGTLVGRMNQSFDWEHQLSSELEQIKSSHDSFCQRVKTVHEKLKKAKARFGLYRS